MCSRCTSVAWTDRRWGRTGAAASGWRWWARARPALCSAKYLLQAGFDVTVFEIGSQIGGMWCFNNDSGRSSAYRTLHINTSRGVTRFSDLDFDADVQPFPDHADMHRYLVKYAGHFGVTPRIRFNSRVAQVRPMFDPGREPAVWEVELADGATERFDAVLIATGHLSKPLHVAELEGFGEGYVHAHYYREPEAFVGKRICVVGVGNSACDIASDVCVTSRRTVLVARSGVTILPKLLFGRPFTDITAQIQRPWIPRKVRQRLVRGLVWLAHGDMTKLGFKRATSLSHVTSNGTVTTDIAYRRIAVKQGIQAVNGHMIQFADGTPRRPFDALIAATGYQIDLDMLPPDVSAGAGQPAGPLHAPRAAGMARPVPDGVLQHRHGVEHGVRAPGPLGAGVPAGQRGAAARLRRCARPSPTGRTGIARSYRDSSRHTIEEEHVRYLGDLRATLKAAMGRAGAAARAA